MSEVLLQEARTISEQLSSTEKVQLIEWLSVQLRQELEIASDCLDSTIHRGNGHTATEPTDEIAPTWTEAEIQEMMKPNPKSGAEIAAALKQLDLSSWQEQDIPDVVEWLENRREQSRHLRQAQWDQLDS